MPFTYQLPPGKGPNESVYHQLVGRYIIENDHSNRVLIPPRKTIRGGGWNQWKKQGMRPR